MINILNGNYLNGFLNLVRIYNAIVNKKIINVHVINVGICHVLKLFQMENFIVQKHANSKIDDLFILG